MTMLGMCLAAFVAPLAPASAQVLGPGTPSVPGFSGYVLANNDELGVGRLPSGEYGLCTDTGSEYPWPSNPTKRMVDGPRTAYALGKYIRPAVNDARLAAALWWAVGLDFGANSQPARVQAHVDSLRAENPGIYADVKRIHDQIVADANANASPATGFKFRVGLEEGRVTNVGVKASSNWVDGFPITLTLEGPARFNSTDTKTWTGNSQATERTPAWTRTGPGEVKVTAVVTDLPDTKYELWWGGGQTQRVLAAAERITLRDTAVLRLGAVYLPLRVSKSAEGGDTAGMYGVSIEVRENDPEGPVVDSWTFGPADLAPWGVTHQFAASPATCTTGCKYDEVNDYYVVITAEPAGWVPVSRVVHATLNAAGTELVADLMDEKIWEPQVSTQISEQVAVPGQTVSDTVLVSNTGGRTIEAYWSLRGPLPASTDGTCTGLDWTTAPELANGPFTVTGDGTYVVGEAVVPTVGCYTYATHLPPTPRTAEVVLPHGHPSETTLVTAQPELVTQISHQKAEAGTVITDAVTITGTGGTTVTGQWTLWGPIKPATAGAGDPRSHARCVGLDWSAAPKAAEGVFTATGDGTYTVGSYKVTEDKVGCYTYTENLEGTSTTRPVPTTEKGIPAETGLVTTSPTLITQVSKQMAQVGTTITDAVTVSKTGGQEVPGNWRLLGPIDPVGPTRSCADLDWSKAKVAADGTFTAKGDGTYTVGEFTVTVAGCYTYTEALSGTDTTEPMVWTAAGIPAETTLITDGPTLITQISSQDVRVGAEITDSVKVAGTGGKTITGTWSLLGPVAPIAGEDPTRSVDSCYGIDWTGAPVAAGGEFTVTGDGTYTVGAHTVAVAGCYTYTESLPQTPTSEPVTSLPGIPAETTLVTAQPELITQISDKRSLLGDTLTDEVKVWNTSGATITGQWKLFGPLDPKTKDGQPSCEDLDWSTAKVAGQGEFTVAGDGTVTVGKHKVTKTGCYTYAEKLEGTSTDQPTEWTEAGIPAETTLAAAPAPEPTRDEVVFTPENPTPDKTVFTPPEKIIDAGGGAAGQGNTALLVAGLVALALALAAGSMFLVRRKGSS